MAGVYEQAVDRESAYERLKGRASASQDAVESLPRHPQDLPGASTRGRGTGTGDPSDAGGALGGLSDLLFGSTGPRGARRDGLAQTAARSAMRSIGSAVGREIIRGVLGSILGGGRRR